MNNDKCLNLFFSGQGHGQFYAVPQPPMPMRYVESNVNKQCMDNLEFIWCTVYKNSSVLWM